MKKYANSKIVVLCLALVAIIALTAARHNYLSVGVLDMEQSIQFDGTTHGGYRTTITATNPTANRSQAFPDATGTILNTGNLSSITDIGPQADLTASKPVFTDASKNLTSVGTQPVNQGGTGLDTYAVGDLLYASGATTLSKLADVAAGSLLRSGGVATAPAWSTATFPAGSAQGDLLYGSAANTWSQLTKDTTATRYLTNTGADNSPAWGAVNLTNGVTGILPLANGGTGVSGALNLRFQALGAGTNAAAAGKTLALMDDTPFGEFTATDADVTCADSATYAATGTNSLKITFSVDSDASDGCQDSVTYDFTDDETMGFWIWSSIAWDAADLAVVLTDDGGAQALTLPAIPALTKTWVNLTLPAGNGDKDVITVMLVSITAQGLTKVASAAADIYIDAAYKWDATEEVALGNAIVQDSVFGVLAVETAAGSANTETNLTHYTDYFVKYTASNESIVWVSDQSANSLKTMYQIQ